MALVVSGTVGQAKRGRSADLIVSGQGRLAVCHRSKLQSRMYIGRCLRSRQQSRGAFPFQIETLKPPRRCAFVPANGGHLPDQVAAASVCWCPFKQASYPTKVMCQEPRKVRPQRAARLQFDVTVSCSFRAQKLWKPLAYDLP